MTIRPARHRTQPRRGLYRDALTPSFVECPSRRTSIYASPRAGSATGPVSSVRRRWSSTKVLSPAAVDGMVCEPGERRIVGPSSSSPVVVRWTMSRRDRTASLPLPFAEGYNSRQNNQDGSDAPRIASSIARASSSPASKPMCTRSAMPANDERSPLPRDAPTYQH
jgi:hypothetical protein